ncbi:MAG: tyrosine-protein phosphatase, partial [Comamonadaceae bacterium]
REAGAVLRGAPNFRDIGGHRSRDGRTVRHDRVFRSGHLGALEPEDIQLLRARLGRDVCVVDLRGSRERLAAPCSLPGATVHSLPVEPTVARKLDALAATGQPLTGLAAERFMREAYEGFVRHAVPAIGALFGHLLADPQRPVVLHCTAGKDRTGFCAAMLLSALEVPRDAVMDDYLHTNQRIEPRLEGRFPPEILRVLARVRPEFLNAAFGAIGSAHGDVDGFLRQAVGLPTAGLDRLRERLLV